MSRLVRVVVVAAVIGIMSSAAPKTSALPRDYVEINYYNCSWQIFTSDYRWCDGSWQYGNHGSYPGAYRESIYTACSTGQVSAYVLEMYVGGAWVPYDGSVTPACECELAGAC